MRQFYFSLFLVIMSIVLCSCQENGKKLIVESQKTEEDLTPPFYYLHLIKIQSL